MHRSRSYKIDFVLRQNLFYRIDTRRNSLLHWKKSHWRRKEGFYMQRWNTRARHTELYHIGGSSVNDVTHGKGDPAIDRWNRAKGQYDATCWRHKYRFWFVCISFKIEHFLEMNICCVLVAPTQSAHIRMISNLKHFIIKCSQEDLLKLNCDLRSIFVSIRPSIRKRSMFEHCNF